MWKAESRLIIGLGGKGTLKMGITLHHLYGFPYIPGSALKGLARTFGIYKIAEGLGIPNLDGDEIKALKKNKQKTPMQILDMLLEMPLDKDPATKGYREQFNAMESFFEKQLKQNPKIKAKEKPIGHLSLIEFLDLKKVNDFRRIFGTMENTGQIVFFDSIPAVIENIIAVEIMTPHFSKYYQEGKFPQENQKPGPLVYLAVKEGVPFLFCLDYRKDPTESETRLLATAKKWLYNGFILFGIGGKTSSGMGRFTQFRS